MCRAWAGRFIRRIRGCIFMSSGAACRLRGMLKKFGSPFGRIMRFFLQRLLDEYNWQAKRRIR
jgi:hypothetical protein